MSGLAKPNFREPWLEANGSISRYWQRFLIDLFARVGGSDAESIAAISALLSALTVSANGNKIEIIFQDSAVQISELKKEIEELRKLVAFVPQQPQQNREAVYDSIFD